MGWEHACLAKIPGAAVNSFSQQRRLAECETLAVQQTDWVLRSSAEHAAIIHSLSNHVLDDACTVHGVLQDSGNPFGFLNQSHQADLWELMDHSTYPTQFYLCCGPCASTSRV